MTVTVLPFSFSCFKDDIKVYYLNEVGRLYSLAGDRGAASRFYRMAGDVNNAPPNKYWVGGLDFGLLFFVFIFGVFIRCFLLLQNVLPWPIKSLQPRNS